MRKTLARVVAGVALAAGLIGFTGVAQASAADYDSGYTKPATSGEAFAPSDYPSLGDLYNNFNAAGGEVGHGAATAVSSAYLGAPLGAAEFGAGVAHGAASMAGLGG